MADKIFVDRYMDDSDGSELFFSRISIEREFEDRPKVFLEIYGHESK